MATADYSKLDAAILAEVAKRAFVLGWHLERLVWRIAADVKRRNRLASWPSEIVARRLQALRKAGRIRYQRKPEGWVLAKKEG